jgi:hypothetical protein
VIYQPTSNPSLEPGCAICALVKGSPKAGPHAYECRPAASIHVKHRVIVAARHDATAREAAEVMHQAALVAEKLDVPCYIATYFGGSGRTVHLHAEVLPLRDRNGIVHLKGDGTVRR